MLEKDILKRHHCPFRCHFTWECICNSYSPRPQILPTIHLSWCILTPINTRSMFRLCVALQHIQIHTENIYIHTIGLFWISKKAVLQCLQDSKCFGDCSYILQGYYGSFGARPVWESERAREQPLETKYTLMGTDVYSNVIYRLMEFGYRCGRDSSTLTCVHDNANCGHQIPLIRAGEGPRAHLKILPAASDFWVVFPHRLMNRFWHFEYRQPRLYGLGIGLATGITTPAD